MKTIPLQDMIAELPADRRAKIGKRTRELIDKEMHLRDLTPITRARRKAKRLATVR